MKKILSPNVVVSSLLCASFAQSALAEKSFDGVNVQLGAGLTYSHVNASGTQDNSWEGSPLDLNEGSGATRFNGLVSLGYSKSIETFNIAANVFYVIGNQSGGRRSGADSYTVSIPDVYTGTLSENISSAYKFKNTWGISLEPGYYFSENVLGYLKLAYVNSSLQSTLSCNSSDGYCDNSTVSANKNVNGFGYGLGAKYAFTRNVYGALDLMGVTYSSVRTSYNWFPDNEYQNAASFKPTQFFGFISLGYRF